MSPLLRINFVGQINDQNDEGEFALSHAKEIEGIICPLMR